MIFGLSANILPFKQKINYKFSLAVALGLFVNTVKIFVYDYHEFQHLNPIFANHERAYAEWLEKQDAQINNDFRVFNNNTMSEKAFLENKIQVACFTFLSSYSFVPYIKSNNESLFGRCNKMYYVGAPKVTIHLTEPSEHVKLQFIQAVSWRSFKSIIDIIFLNPQKYDWYVFTTRNTFFITENFRYFVSVLEKSHPYYLGHPVYQKGYKHPYNILKSGIAINMKAMHTLRYLLTSNKCSTNKFASLDVEMGTCLAKAKIWPYNTKDDKNRHLFIYKTFDDLFLQHDRTLWSHFITRIYEPKKFDGPNNVISLLVQNQAEIELLNFLIYKWKSYGVGIPAMKSNSTSSKVMDKDSISQN